WLKQVGDRVERDEPLFEISTDKVDAEIPSPAAGVLTEIKFKEGETVEVNKVVAVLDGDGGDGAGGSAAPAPVAEAPVTEAATEVAEEESAAPVEAAAPAQEAETTSVASLPGGVTLADVPAESSPEPAAVPAPPGPTSPSPATPKAQPDDEARSIGPRAARTDGERAVSKGTTVEDLRRTKSSPLVRKIASEHNIDIARLEGTGLSGRVTKNDILSFIESGGPVTATADTAQPPKPSQAAAAPPSIQPTAPAQIKPAEGDRVEKMSVMRKKIAEHMVLSRRTSAHVTTVYEIDMTRIARLRDQHKAAFLERTGTKLTYMPFIFQAVVNAIRKFPIFNSQVTGDQIIYKRDINLGMAVALDGGLIVPVIKHADDLSISGLARAANDLADRARTKQLKPDEVTGGTFTITNPGVFGGLFGTPIINQPQVAILGLGKIEKRPRVITIPEGEDYIAIRSLAYFALSFDHRIIDGSDAERFLAYIKELLEEGEFTL
ncbi:MAG TPA: dihydrolipoamide acetyltransferase family protein, partial [Pyrinomonadaceae bacterium]|nr:dihydrolipoamide acetyltransferase family protein [Pyrinomonadaceae bacterium]